MTTTMNLIAKQTVGADGAASVTFSNIPQTYTDIKVVYSARCSDTTNNWNVLIGYFNADSTSSNYPGATTYAFSSATGATTVNKWFGYLPNASGWFGGAFGNGEFYVPNYSVNGVAKTANIESAAEGNSTTLVPMQLTVTRWTGTAPITTITLSCDTGSFLENSTFYLYGISNSTTTQNETVPYASGGDVITTDGSYWYHAFKYSGSFTPLKNLDADILVVAGGGSGGASSGAGGGAGGLRGLSAQALTSSNSYTCTIGAGGAGVGPTNAGNNGSNSSFAGSGLTTISATGGGKGSANSNFPGTGGSGGGGSDVGGQAGAAGNAGGYTPVEGYAGGTGSTAGGGGGGGAGAAGNIGSGTNPGKGGDGVNTYSSWATATSTGVSGYYAGGGSGYVSASSAPGGAGGGGNSGTSASQTDRNGVPNTGSGGGAWPGSGTSGLGGSGIIIVRYAV